MAMYMCPTCGRGISAGRENDHKCIPTRVLSEKKAVEYPFYKSVNHIPKKGGNLQKMPDEQIN